MYIVLQVIGIQNKEKGYWSQLVISYVYRTFTIYSILFLSREFHFLFLPHRSHVKVNPKNKLRAMYLYGTELKRINCISKKEKNTNMELNWKGFASQRKKEAKSPRRPKHAQLKPLIHSTSFDYRVPAFHQHANQEYQGALEQDQPCFVSLSNT